MNNVNSQNLPPTTVKTSGLAIASLILAICGIFTCTLTSIPALILGIVGICIIRKNAQQLKGQGLAIAGIIVSSISIVIIPFFALLMVILMPLMPALSRAKMQAKSIVSQNNVKQICLAMNMYADENDGRLPPADNWPTALTEYIGNTKILQSPSAPHAGRAYAMNKHLDGIILRDIRQPARVVMIFEASPGCPPAGDRDLLPHGPPGPGGYVIGFVDGHVEAVPQNRLDDLIWLPGAPERSYDIIR